MDLGFKISYFFNLASKINFTLLPLRLSSVLRSSGDIVGDLSPDDNSYMICLW